MNTNVLVLGRNAHFSLALFDFTFRGEIGKGKKMQNH